MLPDLEGRAIALIFGADSLIRVITEARRVGSRFSGQGLEQILNKVHDSRKMQVFLVIPFLAHAHLDRKGRLYNAGAGLLTPHQSTEAFLCKSVLDSIFQLNKKLNEQGLRRVQIVYQDSANYEMVSGIKYINSVSVIETALDCAANLKNGYAGRLEVDVVLEDQASERIFEASRRKADKLYSHVELMLEFAGP